MKTLIFPDDIDYQQSGYPPLSDDLIEENLSVRTMRTTLVKRGFHKSILDPKGLEFKKLSELEKHLF